MVRDAYWLHAHWEITSGTIQRAQAAMAEYWHTAKPVLRLFHVETGNTTSTIEAHVRDIPIHGGVDNWYIDVTDPPKGYRVEIGFVSAIGRFQLGCSQQCHRNAKTGLERFARQELE